MGFNSLSTGSDNSSNMTNITGYQTNHSSIDPEVPLTWDDATWILTSSFIIFTMQSGFGLLESGVVHEKNEVNIMVKNAVDVIFGGITYWMFGYGLSFGDGPYSNPFVGVGYFFLDSFDENKMGLVYSTFIFQLSFATTATTIESGAMAERTNLTAYIWFSMFNTIVYCIPAHWMWADNGFLNTLGVVDIAGSGGVHLLGAVSALVAAKMLGPRLGRFDKGHAPPPLGNPTNCLVGMFMLWWGWLGFNCGSTFGISGGKWILAAKAAVATINGSVGGGFVAIIISYIWRKRKYNVSDIVNGVLGALVAVTAPCAVVKPWEAIIIGAIGGAIAVLGANLVDRMRIDDPVGAVAVHGFAGIWGMLSVGFFAARDHLEDFTKGRNGLFHGGGPYLLGIQSIAIVVIIAWSATITFILLFVISLFVRLRLTEEEEILGSDYVEHDIGNDTQIEILLENRRLSRPRSAFGLTRRFSPGPSIKNRLKVEPMDTDSIKEEGCGTYQLQTDGDSVPVNPAV